MSPEEQLENSRRIKRNWKVRHPEARPRHDAVRRLLKSENFVEDINPIVLAERDQWICHICSQPIDRTLTYIDQDTGKINQGYRTIDHVIALSRGGDHSYANTKIAHWICNVRRWTGERKVSS